MQSLPVTEYDTDGAEPNGLDTLCNTCVGHMEVEANGGGAEANSGGVEVKVESQVGEQRSTLRACLQLCNLKMAIEVNTLIGLSARQERGGSRVHN